ncbi:DUF5677 domain-containing protein [Pseudomonas spelaei]
MESACLKWNATVKKNGAIQKHLDKALTQAALPENVLLLALARSVKRLGLQCDEPDLKALGIALNKAEDGVIKLDLDIPCSLGRTGEEIQDTVNCLVNDLNETVKEVSDQIADAVPQVVQTTLEKMADLIEDELLAQAMEHTENLNKIEELRVNTVERLWGKALDQLNMLRHLVVEWNTAAAELKKGAYANSHTALALSRVILRAYSVVGEIIALARAGYADGALARWRSLHEICVIAMFLSKQSDKCAQMYLSHSLIEELRLIESGEDNGTISAKNTEDDQYLRALKKQKRQLVEAFGPAFAKDYGWASIELGRAKITFRELESIVGMEVLRQGYQHANSATHGGALAALTRISLGMGVEYSGEISPAFGCEVAMSYAAGSLSTLIAELCLETENADLLVMNIVAQKFSSNVREHIKNSKGKLSRVTPRVKFKLRQMEKSVLKSKRGGKR